jgi:hypothetical protein
LIHRCAYIPKERATLQYGYAPSTAITPKYNCKHFISQLQYIYSEQKELSKLFDLGKEISVM